MKLVLKFQLKSVSKCVCIQFTVNFGRLAISCYYFNNDIKDSVTSYLWVAKCICLDQMRIFCSNLFNRSLNICTPSYKRVEMQDREAFPDSRRGREKPFKMYTDNPGITVQLTDLEPGWRSGKTNNAQASYNFCIKTIWL